MILYHRFSFFLRHMSALQAPEHTVAVKSSPPKTILSLKIFRQVAKFLGVIAFLLLADISRLNMLRFQYGITITSTTRVLNFDSSF